MGDNDNPLTFTRNDDGTISVKGEDGAEIRFAKESDLLAVKGSREVAEAKVKEIETSSQAEAEARKAELGTATTNLETSRQQVLQAEAKIEELEKKVTEGAGSAEELATVKQELETAKKSGEEQGNKVLEYRRQVIIVTYGIPAKDIETKTLEQLDAYEEALKSVMATKGLGNFAVGGGVGAGPTTEKPLDRAKRILAESEAAGHLIGGGGSSFKQPDKD